MSRNKKKWRKPANPDYKPEPHCGDVAVADSPEATTTTTSPSAKASENGPPAREVVDGVAKPLPDLNISEDDARGYLNEVARFLGAVVKITNHVIDALPAEEVREAVAPREPEEQPKHKRAKAQPLLALMRYGIAASRLMHTLLQRLHPQLFSRGPDHPQDITHTAAACAQLLRSRLPGLLNANKNVGATT
ncbi:MAG: hypothetical protein H6839_13150 [Planctomycetes bacterium]|nr:hypothetical protein [Planctomycetota bacterium]